MIPFLSSMKGGSQVNSIPVEFSMERERLEGGVSGAKDKGKELRRGEGVRSFRQEVREKELGMLVRGEGVRNVS